MYYTYLLKLSNDDYYAGSTEDLKQRLEYHQSGKVSHTSKFRLIELVWYSGFASKKLAISFKNTLSLHRVKLSAINI